MEDKSKMKITILKENLSKGLSIVGRVVSSRGSLEILSNILIKTSKGRVCLSATNLEIGISYMVGAKVESDGAITVPAKLFSEFINSLPSEKITLELDGDTLKCKTDDYKTSIKGISADEFPLIPEIKEKKTFSINGVKFRDAVNLVGLAASLDDSRPILSGVYIKVSGTKVVLAATDSYRLAENIVSVNADKNKKEEIVVPARTLIELSRILGELKEDIEVNAYITENQILFEANGLELVSRLIEGQFPNYKQIIPENTESVAKVDKSELLGAVKVASLFARENANSIKVAIKEKGKVEINSQGSQVGENIATIKADVKGKTAEASFNGKYISDVLVAMKDKDVELGISGKLNPGVIKSAKNKDYTYIIMPLRN